MIGTIPDKLQAAELQEFSNALMGLFDQAQLSDSNLSNARRSMKELMLNNLTVYEDRIVGLESSLKEREAALATTTAKLKAETEKAGKMQLELLELNRFLKQFEDSHRKSISDSNKYTETLQKTIAELQGEVGRLNQRIQEGEQRARQAEEETESATKLVEAKELEISNIRKNFVPLDKYRRVLEEREVALEKAAGLENNLLTQTTHNEKLRDRLNIVKQEFQSTLSDNDERHKKEIHDIHNTAAKKFDTTNTPRDLSQKLGPKLDKDGMRAKSHTANDIDSGKRNSFKGIDTDNLRISWEHINLGDSQARDEGEFGTGFGGQRGEKRGSLVGRYEELNRQFEQFKTENKKELASANSKNRSLLEEVGRLKAEIQKVNVEKNTLKKSLNEAASRDNSFIRKSSNQVGPSEVMEKVGKLEKQLTAAKKENKSLKARIEEDGVRRHQHSDLLFTACLAILRGDK